MSAIKAEFVDCYRVPTRKVCKIEFECPEEYQKAIYDALGYPNSSSSIWVAMALLTPEAAKPVEENHDAN